MQQRTIDAMPGAISARYIRQKTEKSYRQYMGSLNLFFQGMPLKEIHIGHLKSYQIARSRGAAPFIRPRRPHEEPKSSPVKAQQINKEITFLRSIMRRAGCWGLELSELYEELQEQESELQRALTPEEQQRWIEVSRLNERWELIYWYSIVAFDTTMSTNELRGLRIGDVNLHHQVVNVPWPAAKNKYRHRSIAIESADCLWAFDQLLRRAHELGSQNPQHYLFPFRLSRGKPQDHYDPTKAMSDSGLKRLWEEVRTASGLRWFRPYDTRHTAITRLAEAGIPIEVIKSKAGHVSAKMSQHYTHISLSTQRRWMQFANELKRPPVGDYNPYQSQMNAHPMFRRGR